MDESFGITRYDPQHINVLTDQHLSPQIETESLSPESILKRAGKQTVYELLSNWSKELSPGSEVTELYPIPEYTAWEDIPVTIKMARLASFIGLHIQNRFGELTPELISKSLNEYESKIIEFELKDFTEYVINDWNNLYASTVDSRSLPVDTVDRCIFLPQSRIKELSDNDAICWVTEEGEAIVPIDRIDAPPRSDMQYNYLAHELTHIARLHEKDNVFWRGRSLRLVTMEKFNSIERLNKAIWMVEAVAEIAAAKMSDHFNHPIDTNSSSYPAETFGIRIIQNILNIGDFELVQMPLSKLINMINDKYEGPQTEFTAFDELSNDIEKLKQAYKEDNPNPEKVFSVGDQLIERWYTKHVQPINSRILSIPNSENELDGEIFYAEDEVITGDE